jgi:hypothetical protein
MEEGRTGPVHGRGESLQGRRERVGGKGGSAAMGREERAGTSMGFPARARGYITMLSPPMNRECDLIQR